MAAHMRGIFSVSSVPYGHQRYPLEIPRACILTISGAGTKCKEATAMKCKQLLGNALLILKSDKLIPCLFIVFPGPTPTAAAVPTPAAVAKVPRLQLRNRAQ